MPTVLVVDDSPIDRQLVGGLLKQDTDWTVTYAGDGAAALDSIRTSPPDIVVTDLQMPEMTGLELVIAVRKSFAQVPVVLMTGKGSEEIAVEALHAGAASYVPKRALATMLVDTVLARARIDGELAAATARFQVTLAEADFERQRALLAERIEIDAAMMRLAESRRDD